MPMAPSNVCFSNRPFRVKRFQTIHHYSVDVAHGLVLLFGIGTRGPSIMGFEDEVEQSFGRPCRQTNGRSKRTCELTSSIVPRGTSFHRSVELECPSIGLDAARFSNRPFRVKRFQTIHHYSVDVAHGLVLLFGIGTRGPSIMGFEDEVEQSFGRPCRQCDCRFKRPYELTSSIVPRGTSFHRSVELECPSIGLDAARFSCCCCGLFSGYRNSCIRRDLCQHVGNKFDWCYRVRKYHKYKLV